MSPTEERKATPTLQTYYDSQLVQKKKVLNTQTLPLADFAGAKVTAQLKHFPLTQSSNQITGVDKQVAMDNFSQQCVALQAGTIGCLRF